MRMRFCSSIARTVTWTEKSYISQSHWTCLPGSNLPLLRVNQNLVVMSGLINASNTSTTGLRISISVSAHGLCVICKLSIDYLLQMSRSASHSFYVTHQNRHRMHIFSMSRMLLDYEAVLSGIRKTTPGLLSQYTWKTGEKLLESCGFTTYGRERIPP